jgi:hypothetical protein
VDDWAAQREGVFQKINELEAVGFESKRKHRELVAQSSSSLIDLSSAKS